MIAALAFDPLRGWLQTAADRRFDRDRSRALEGVADFAARLREGHAEPQEVEGMLRSALGDPDLRLLVWLPEAGVHADVLGNPRSAPLPAPGQVVTAVGRGDAPLGLVVHAQGLLERPVLLADVLRAASLPIEIARLHCELRGRLDEVADSRIRIVRAGYEERRRLERDLHDGAQQQLVALGMSLRLVQRRQADPEVDHAIDAAVARSPRRCGICARSRAGCAPASSTRVSAPPSRSSRGAPRSPCASRVPMGAPALAHRPHGRDARAQHPRQARHHGVGRRPPARPRRPLLSARRRELTVRLSASA